MRAAADLSATSLKLSSGPVLFLLLALVQGMVVASDRHLPAYQAVLSRYAGGERIAALKEIRTWKPADIDATLAELRSHGNDLRAVPASPAEIDFRAVEAAVLLHAEVGLLALQSSATVNAGWHLGKSVTLFEWSRDAARKVRERGAARLRLPGNAPPKPLPAAFDIRERIVPRDFYLALATSALVFGQAPTARTYARRALAVAPLDAEAHLVFGCASEYAANEVALNENDAVARRFRGEAESAFRKALAADAGSREARLRLGHLLLMEGELAESEQLLAPGEAPADDARGRYLTALFLGRAAEGLGRPADAMRQYRRALEAWPSAQTARLALAHVLEKEGDPAAARAQVAASLEASRQDGRPYDPFWLYLFGPAGLAKAKFDRVFAIIER
jgi:tetratricopeptide (TPR) repeat protein